MESYQTRIEQAKKAIAETEYILLGAGPALVEAARITYRGERFLENIHPSLRHFELNDRYMFGLSMLSAQEERWGLWAKLNELAECEAEPSVLYKDIYRLIRDKPYFVLTSTVDSQLKRAGFSTDKVFEVQGNYGKLQCAIGCHAKSYRGEIPMMEMVEHIVDYKIPPELIPKCPECGGEMLPNIRNNNYFVQDTHFLQLEALYKGFVRESMSKKRLYIGIGIEHEPLVVLKQDDPTDFEQNNRLMISFHEGISETISDLLSLK